MKHKKRGGFSLGELLAVLLILSVVAAILYPVFAKSRHEGSNRNSCHSNIKQVELALLQYIQDYDEKFPPCAQPMAGEKILSGWALSHDYFGMAAFPKAPKDNAEKANLFDFGLLSTYAKNRQIFRCPEALSGEGPLTYMLNDLAAGVNQNDFAAVASTVLTCDGENFMGNVGHAYDPKTAATPATFLPDGTVLVGATLETAPIRHNDGANYGYADGHVKWSKPEVIFFPSRFSTSRSHIDAKTRQLLGPDPANLRDPKAVFRNGSSYGGTFHIK